MVEDPISNSVWARGRTLGGLGQCGFDQTWSYDGCVKRDCEGRWVHPRDPAQLVPVDGVGGGICRWIVCVRYLFSEFHSTRCLPQRSFDGGFCEPEEVFPVPLFLELSGLELDGFLVAFIYVTDGSDARSPLSAGFWCCSRAMGFFAQATP